MDQLVDVVDWLRGNPLQVYPWQCSKRRHKLSHCTLCIDYCPAVALAWDGSLRIDVDRCTGCGVCATVCPNGVFEVRASTSKEIVSQISEIAKAGGPVCFACPVYLEETGQSKGADGLAVVDCLGRLDESILIGAISLGARTVWLIDGSCEGCTHTVGHTVAMKVVQSANLLLGAFGIPEPILMGGELPPRLDTADRPQHAIEELSRRAFFVRVASDTTRTVAAAIDTVLGGASTEARESRPPEKGKLPVRLPAKRRLLLTALKHLAEPSSGPVEVHDGPFAQFGIEESCAGCQMCAFFCPTGALRKMVLEGKVGLAFRLASCTSCRLCQDICYWNAVVLSPFIEPAKLLHGTEDTLLVPNAAALRRRTSWPIGQEDP